DISHSSVERIVLPDATMIACYCLRRTARLVDGLVVNVDRMRENLVEGSLGLVFSQGVLLALVSAGLARDEAYRLVQRDALVASRERVAFRGVLEKDPEVESALGGAAAVGRALDRAFDLERSLAGAAHAVEAARTVSP
ncbi:MAG: hypothetical protein ACRD0B_07565, partial [Acidimicrobiales bacterium]